MNKETIPIVITGHVDHGKSTLIGRLLFETDSLPKEKIMEIRKISRQLGRDTELAFLTDQLEEERRQSMTIDTTQIFFKTSRRNYVIIDSPGHVEFVRHMITGTTQAKAAILIVDVSEGIMEQTKRHLYIIDMLGIESMIVVLNKMDLIGYQKERFEEVKTALLNFLKTLKIRPAFIIPISAKEGLNVSKRSAQMGWYRGPSLLGALDLIRPALKTREGPLRFPVQDIYDIDGTKIIVGKVLSGTILPGQRIVFFPSLKATRVIAIKVFGEFKKRAEAGENIGLILEDASSVKRGQIISEEKNPPEPTDHLKADIFWMSNSPLEVGETINLRCATQEVQCRIDKIEKRIDSSTLEIIEEDARELKLNEAGVVLFKTERPIVVEKFKLLEELGRFVIERGFDLQGAGIIP